MFSISKNTSILSYVTSSNFIYYIYENNTSVVSFIVIFYSYALVIYYANN